MRRAIVWTLLMVLCLGLVRPASAGWFRVGHHFGHVRHVGHAYRHWVYRPVVRHHFHHRYARSFVYRHPHFHGHVGFPWHGVVRRHVVFPTGSYHFSSPVWSVPVYSSPVYWGPVYSGYPLCAANEPALGADYGSSYASAVPGARTFNQSKIIEFGRDVGQDVGADRAAWSALLAGYRATLPQAASDPAWETPAARLVNYGDRLFRGEFYAEALAKYDAAARLTDHAAEIEVRRGYALLALQRYSLAAAALRDSLRRDAEYLRSGFRSSELFGAQATQPTAHIEMLAGTALQAEADADLHFLLGVLLHGEGQVERARAFFQRAADLSGGDATHLEVFLRNRAAPADRWAQRPTPAGQPSATAWKFASHTVRP
ncbi:MAG: tetratricopeptide repeat protein [Pirellulaceae bacterium]|nr:tetratricopeptide repeat protein [Pirellulaceae bacterium]